MSWKDADVKGHLGVGWAFPVKPRNGRLTYAWHEEDIDQAIQIILMTAPRERVMLPQFGAGVRQFVFEPNSPATHQALAGAVRRALIDWEPRIDLHRVEVTPDPGEPNVLLIQIDYTVRATNTHCNRVFPFYLFEGGV